MARMALVFIALAAAVLCAQAVPSGYGYAAAPYGYGYGYAAAPYGYAAGPVYGGYGHGGYGHGYGHGYYADSVADVKVYQNPKHYEFDVVEKGKGFSRYHHQQADTPYGYYGGYSKY